MKQKARAEKMTKLKREHGRKTNTLNNELIQQQ